MKNNDLRLRIVEMIVNAGEGHIPSSFSIVDIIDHLYGKVLKIKPDSPDDADRDYFILSKGHGCAALFVVLEKYGYLSSLDLALYSSPEGILGGHPDCTKVPGVEASTGSLGHGMVTALGIAMGLKILRKPNLVYSLVGDGECHEGTIWEAANVAANLNLSNFCVVVDWNGSAAQLMPIDNLSEKWTSFGWNVICINGHKQDEINDAFESFGSAQSSKPTVIIASTIKGKGVSFIEGHGKWHHKIPTKEEIQDIKSELLV